MIDKNGIELYTGDVVLYQDSHRNKKIGIITYVSRMDRGMTGIDNAKYYDYETVSTEFKKANNEDIIYWKLTH
jgi:hypothetical protein